MSRLLLTTVLPTAVTAATALAVWLGCKGAGGNADDAGDAARRDLRVVPPGGSLATTDADELSVVSWNVLADSFASKLDYAAPEHLDWAQHRWPLIKRRLLAWAADVVMLQEVDVVWLQDWLQFAEAAGYAAVHQDTKGKQVVCLTLYRPSKLELWWVAGGRSRGLPAAFLFTDSSRTLQVIYTANLHLEGSPYKPQERLNQLRTTLASLVKHQASAGLPPEDCHVVVAGDFNSGRGEGPLRLLTQGWLPAGYREAHLPNVVVVPEGGPAAGRGSGGGGGRGGNGGAGGAAEGGDVTQPYLLVDAYAREPLPFTRKVPSLASHLDWVLVSPSLRVVALLWPLDETQPGDRRLPHSRMGLPNASHASDHLPLGAQLRVLPAGALMQH